MRKVDGGGKHKLFRGLFAVQEGYMLFRRLIRMPRRVVYCSGGYMLFRRVILMFRKVVHCLGGVICCSCGLYGCSGGLYDEKNNYDFSNH